MSILEILEGHTVKRPWSEASRMRCKCGETVTAETEGQLYTLHRAHVAQVLEQHEREATAEALEEAAAAGELLDPDPEMYDKQLNAVPVWTWLRNRAAQLKETP